MKFRSLVAVAALALSLAAGAADAQQVGQFGILSAGTPSGTAPRQGDVNISGQFKQNGVPVAGSGLGTATNCTSGASPAVCGAATAGGGAVATGSNPTLVVDTTAVTAASLIMVTADESLGTKLGVTCNTTITTVAPIVVTARTPGTSFTVEVDATVATNPACFSWVLVN